MSSVQPAILNVVMHAGSVVQDPATPGNERTERRVKLLTCIFQSLTGFTHWILDGIGKCKNSV